MLPANETVIYRKLWVTVLHNAIMEHRDRIAGAVERQRKRRRRHEILLHGNERYLVGTLEMEYRSARSYFMGPDARMIIELSDLNLSGKQIVRELERGIPPQMLRSLK